MFRIILTFAILCVGVTVHSQQKAVTENGEQVILYPDGRWSYIERDESKEIPVNHTEYLKPAEATFLLKSNKLNVGVWLNPKVWTFAKSDENSASEYSFVLRGEEAWGMIITESASIPLENMAVIALDNARDVAPDIKAIEKEYRTVNGKKVMYMRMDGTTQGMKVTYFGYYYTDSTGTVQMLVYTTQNAAMKYKDILLNLLNGFVVL